jgi:nicotinamidase-related amidase
MNIQLLCIDPQVDFCKPLGSLYVPGADEDMQRLAALINRLGKKFDDIHVTLDSHHQVDIAHPIYWIDNATGKHPSPFTIISAQDIRDGKYTTYNPGLMKSNLAAGFIGARDYVEALEKNNRYPLCIWPVHCDIAGPGYAIHDAVYAELVKWEVENFAIVNKVTKGSNYATEHYSAVQADVPQPNDMAGTSLNMKLIKDLIDADVIAIAGEALSHCVNNTVTDIANAFGDDTLVSKFTLLTDCTSNVPGFEHFGNDFITKMTKRGMKLSDSINFFK